MKVLITGSGISGLAAAIRSAELGSNVILLSPFVSERAQSVMAAGGINAVSEMSGENDSIELHVQDTLDAGCRIENEEDVRELCKAAPDIVKWLDSIGVIFSRDESGGIARRAFGGQSRRRTAYAGASTGKQIMTALIQKCREYEIKGRIERRTGLDFHSILTDGIRCCGAVFTDRVTGEVTAIQSDAVIMATGGMNKIFGKTTGSELCDGYAAGRLFTQGARIRNAEMIQYHPTSIETSNKRMLISEAARGEGGRLYYEEGGRRVYFMEDRFGEGGNLMPRDVVSRCIDECPSQVYLDISFLGKKLIHERLEEIYETCREYIGIDVTEESIPVGPAVHFFMGGIRVDERHMTDIDGLYAVGEAASKYHGANRLGGNSLLAAVYSGRIAAKACIARGERGMLSFDRRVDEVRAEMNMLRNSDGRYSISYIQKELADVMNSKLGIRRDAENLRKGIAAINELIGKAEMLKYDEGRSLYENYRIRHMLIVSSVMMKSALSREESRGAHFRSDHPDAREEFRRCSLASYENAEIKIDYEDDGIR